ncbi:MAG: putative purine permease YbbY [Pelotomaculum sp. PtaB.Bin104]|nr:MAG: putative purine permease YbbY [Pelotomaculum sp. PtaB.Bin104]
MARFVCKYKLDEVPPPLELFLFGLQWLAILIPSIVIIGKVLAGFHHQGAAEQLSYMQKAFFVTALALLGQVLWGHRLPLIIGPASVLLVGMASGSQGEPKAVYTSIMICGILYFLLAATGFFGYLIRLFTPRVIAVILVLIALTMSPIIMNLIITPVLQASALFNLFFALALLLCIFVSTRLLSGVWKSALVVWATLAGCLAYYIFFPEQFRWETGGLDYISASFFSLSGYNFALDLPVLLSLLVCFLALAINDLGSIQSVCGLIEPERMEQRITRGLSATGLSNGLAGMLGVVGLVNYSLSPGVIVPTSCASRYTLVPAGLGLLVISFCPPVVALFDLIPRVVIGSVLLYIMSSQIAAGLMVAFSSIKIGFNDGLVIGLPFMLGILVSFLPAEVTGSFPIFIRPLLGNGFVVGVLAVLFLEHVVRLADVS